MRLVPPSALQPRGRELGHACLAESQRPTSHEGASAEYPRNDAGTRAVDLHADEQPHPQATPRIREKDTKDSQSSKLLQGFLWLYRAFQSPAPLSYRGGCRRVEDLGLASKSLKTVKPRAAVAL